MEEGGDPIEAAEVLIASGRADQAARDLRARLDAGRGGLLARLTLIKALLILNDTPHALEEAREAVSLNPNVAVAVLVLGESLLAAEALPTAIAELQRALPTRAALSTLWRVIDRLGLTVKKNRTRRRTAPT